MPLQSPDSSKSDPPLCAPQGSPKFPHLESEILEFWDEHQIYQRSLDARRGATPFVFYEGPPTANGLPHPGHCLTRAIKDVFPRYKTMKGFYCERKAGWDTHGLPVEVEVSKDLGIHNRDEIVAYGEEAFIQQCQRSVFRYINQWQTMTRRLGFWVDLEKAYVTYHQSYVESVWWSLKNLFDRGLLYYGNKIVWWWAQGGTALSSGEVGEGYREVADPSVYVKFPLLDSTSDSPGQSKPTRSLVIWTTTPWTLPSNMFAAVHPTDVDYVIVQDGDEELIVASALVETIAAKLKRELPIVGKIAASDLVGARYEPPFDTFATDHADSPHYFRVVAADFVTTDAGTGIVHLAPAFGETDNEVFKELNAAAGGSLTAFCCVNPDGKFDQRFDLCAGVWVKDADKTITTNLKQTGRLLLLDQYLHDYPFCWRAKEDPLIQYPRSGWFIRTTRFKDLMLENNAQIGWQPEHIQEGRFGNFLRSNVDWELSRERFWGTPLPIWVCQSTGRAEAIGCYDELLAKPGVTGTEVWDKAKAADPDLVDDLRVHKPYIDAITYDSPFQDGAVMKRVSDVIDCWYDSGAMPFAQHGWPHKNDELFRSQFPADFISEAIDQTRGWFYSQLAISTMLFGKGAGISVGENGVGENGDDKSDATTEIADVGDGGFPMPFRNCIVLGLMLAEDGKKLSKQDRNYREPAEIFDKYGADALRWFLLSGQAPWTSVRYSESTIKESIPEFLLRLWNCYSFLTIYAEIDRFDPSGANVSGDGAFSDSPDYRPIAERPELDRWLISKLNQTIAVVTERMDALDNHAAAAALNDLVDGLSNWYVRRSRDRFWSSADRSAETVSQSDLQAKMDAYWTLYETLIRVVQMAAPFTPFLAEKLYRELIAPMQDDATVPRSVHLCDFPTADPALIDADLADSMSLLREIASLGRSARADAKLKVRLPLASVTVVLSNDRQIDWLKAHDELIREELNVKSVDYTTDGQDYVQYEVVPNFRRLGPKVGKRVPLVKKTLASLDGGELLSQLSANGSIQLDLDGDPITLDTDDIDVRLTARDGWAAAQGKQCVVVLNTEVTDELRREGIARDLIRGIQSARKTIGCEYVDRIDVAIVSSDADVAAAVAEHDELIRGETLADSIVDQPIDDGESSEVGGATLFVRRKS